MAKNSAMAIGGDDDDGDGGDGDADADLVQHPLHVHRRLGNREQRHRTWQGPRSVADWYFDLNYFSATASSGIFQIWSRVEPL